MILVTGDIIFGKLPKRDALSFMFFTVFFLDYNLQVSPRLKDRMVERDRPVSNFVMSQDICLHLSDLLALYSEKRDTFHTHCHCPKKSGITSCSVRLCT